MFIVGRYFYRLRREEKNEKIDIIGFDLDFSVIHDRMRLW